MPAPNWLSFKVALVPSTSAISPIFAIVRPVVPFGCPVLGAPLAQVARMTLPSFPQVLVYRDGYGDWRSYGDPELVRDAFCLDLDNLPWVDLEPLGHAVRC